MWVKLVFPALILASQINYIRSQEDKCVSCVPIDPDNCEGELELFPFDNLHQNFK